MLHYPGVPAVQAQPAQPVAVEPAESEPAALPAPTEPLELVFVGDVMFGRWREAGMAAIDYQGFDVFGPMHDLLAADITLANLETPIVRDVPALPPYGTRLRFAAPPSVIDVLRRAGITTVTLANNHSFDMKFTGLRETPEVLAEHGMGFIGACRSEAPLFRAETFTSVGWKIAFIAATNERNGPQRKNAPELPYVHVNELAKMLAPVVSEARPHHDLVIVVLHWGVEYQQKPGTRQIRAARALIDAGADAVIGHHPHVLQAIERYKNGLIAYSLGNFLFDNTSKSQQLTGALRLRYQPAGRCLERAVMHPAYVKRAPTYHPHPADQSMRQQVGQRIITLSKEKPFTTAWQLEGRDLVLASPPCPPTDEPVTN